VPTFRQHPPRGEFTAPDGVSDGQRALFEKRLMNDRRGAAAYIQETSVAPALVSLRLTANVVELGVCDGGGGVLQHPLDVAVEPPLALRPVPRLRRNLDAVLRGGAGHLRHCVMAVALRDGLDQRLHRTRRSAVRRLAPQ
jgi:hypothetical protein